MRVYSPSKSAILGGSPSVATSASAVWTACRSLDTAIWSVALLPNTFVTVGLAADYVESLWQVALTSDCRARALVWWCLFASIHRFGAAVLWAAFVDRSDHVCDLCKKAGCRMYVPNSTFPIAAGEVIVTVPDSLKARAVLSCHPLGSYSISSIEIASQARVAQGGATERRPRADLSPKAYGVAVCVSLPTLHQVVSSWP